MTGYSTSEPGTKSQEIAGKVSILLFSYRATNGQSFDWPGKYCTNPTTATVCIATGIMYPKQSGNLQKQVADQVSFYYHPFCSSFSNNILFSSPKNITTTYLPLWWLFLFNQISVKVSWIQVEKELAKQIELFFSFLFNHEITGCLLD